MALSVFLLLLGGISILAIFMSDLSVDAEAIGTWYPPFRGLFGVVCLVCAASLYWMKKSGPIIMTVYLVVNQVVLLAIGRWNYLSLLLSLGLIAALLSQFSKMNKINTEATAHLTEVPPEPRRKSPGLAWFLALVVPGAGQVYCGKIMRGLVTFLFFLVFFLRVLFLPESGDKAAELIWGITLRASIFLYVFGFLDAYFTAREINTDLDTGITKNPRIAAILNLLTYGFGYFYLGQIGKGIIIVILLSSAFGGAVRIESEAGSLALSMISEVAAVVFALDAYRCARIQLREQVAVLPTSLAPHQPAKDLRMAFPLGLACVFVLFYVALWLLA